MNSQIHRRAQLALLEATESDLRRLWPMFDLERMSETRDTFEQAVVMLVRARGRVSAGLAAAFYRSARRAAGVPGEPPPMRSTPTVDEIVGGLRSMGPLSASKALRLGRALDDVRRTTLVNISGVVTKYTLDHGRDVLLNAVKDDPRATSWTRQTSGTPCDFCGMLAGRGAVYKTEETAGFASHRHCACTPVPAW